MKNIERVKGFSSKKGDANYFPDCVRDFWADTGLSTDISDLEVIINWFDSRREGADDFDKSCKALKEKICKIVEPAVKFIDSGLRKITNIDKNTKFYVFRQNNSGGKWRTDENKGVAQVVIIEAESADLANLRAQQIGIYFDGVSGGSDCECCGDRWSKVYQDKWDCKSDLDEVVSEFRASHHARQNYQVYVHYLDGRFEKVDLNADSNPE